MESRYFCPAVGFKSKAAVGEAEIFLFKYNHIRDISSSLVSTQTTTVSNAKCVYLSPVLQLIWLGPP